MNPAAVLLSSSFPPAGGSVYRPDYASSKSWQFILSLSKDRTLQHLYINQQKCKTAVASSAFIKIKEGTV